MNIRLAVDADFLDVWALHHASGLLPFLYQGFVEWFAQHTVFVAEDGNCILGFVMIQSLLDQDEVLLLTVAEDFRCLGVGKQLLSHILKPNRLVFLEVASDNLPAQHLYKNLGFFQVGLRKNYYAQGRDALVMQGPPHYP